jgi:CheY-like chemotaxis protein
MPDAVIVSHSMLEETRPYLNELNYVLPVLSLVLPASGYRIGALPTGITNYFVKPGGREVLHKTLAALPDPVLTILVVDDVSAMRRFVNQVLRMDNSKKPIQDYRFLIAATGEEALGILYPSRWGLSSQLMTCHSCYTLRDRSCYAYG